MTETFGKRLELAMQKKGWDQQRLATESTLSPGAVSRHLERQEPPKPDSIEKYRKALGVSSEWLAYGRGDMNLLHEAAHMQQGFVRLVGSDALESVLAHFDWPDEDIAIIDAVMADARAEAFSNGKDRPESAWNLRVRQLLRERMGRAKAAPQREPTKVVDTTQESPEVQEVRKRSRRL